MQLVKDSGNKKEVFTLLPSTLNSPIHKECPRAVSNIVKPAIMTVLQDSHEEECPQPAEKTYLKSFHINQAIIH